MESWDNEDSIYVFALHVRKVFVSVVTGKNTGTFFLGHPVHYVWQYVLPVCQKYEKHEYILFLFASCSNYCITNIQT